MISHTDANNSTLFQFDEEALLFLSGKGTRNSHSSIHKQKYANVLLNKFKEPIRI